MDKKSFENGGWECQQQTLCLSSKGTGGRTFWLTANMDLFQKIQMSDLFVIDTGEECT